MLILRVLIQTNLFIAIAAVCFLLSNAYLLELPINHLKEVILLVFSSTWLVYQFSRWFYFKKDAYTHKNDSVFHYMEKYPIINNILLIVAAILVFISVFFIHKNVLYFLFIVGCISFLYPIPIIKYQSKWIKLREIPFIKLFLIAGVWSVACIILPIVELNIWQDFPTRNVLLFITQFVFILFITLPFDMNDFPYDKAVGVKTIPTVFGIKTSQMILLILWLIQLVLWILFFSTFSSITIQHITIGIAYMLLNTFLLVYTKKKITTINKEQVKYIYDGSMIVQFLITFLVFRWM
ncbi:MAG: hypothetical protein H6553_05205 [Chitinophagales bacterium]|nr:hypothetical protein [Chitinophagales bacterium]